MEVAAKHIPEVSSCSFLDTDVEFLSLKCRKQAADVEVFVLKYHKEVTTYCHEFIYVKPCLFHSSLRISTIMTE